jgi:hypothetical protein
VTIRGRVVGRWVDDRVVFVGIGNGVGKGKEQRDEYN